MAGFKRGYDGKIAGLYDLDKTLGRGHFAVVKLARHVFTGEKVAVKVIDKTKLDTLATGHLFQEVRCMKLVQHPNIVRLYEVIDTQTKLYLILELGDGGDMFDYIMKHEEGLNEDLAKKYFAQIVHAISYCHKLHVVHRDLKPENVVFFEKQGLVKLTDFGFSNKFQPGKKLTTSCGSLAYSAPEILLGDEYDAPAVVLLLIALPVTYKPRSNEIEVDAPLKRIIYSTVLVVCLITRMLQRDPKRRASLEEIENHPWLQGVDPSPATKYNIPLVSYKNLSEEEHNSIIQRMVLGDIADRDAIVEALETNRYNHITATYFLLAERILREKQEKEIQTRSASPSNIKAQFSAGELVQSLKLMGLCLGSQLRGGTKYILDPQHGLSFSSVKVQEKSTWKMCISSAGNLGQAPVVGSLKFFSDHVADSTTELERIQSRNLKNNVLQLPLCEKTISVNIQRNPKEGLLCASGQATCCHVI
ncbi:SNF-related serine/threonine-protein kinase [Myotis davidii]|uniref:SNF-related serine/threonine-protein kinase n=1 Tax=Myotis davidii TaxID=225400 RepID=L5LUU5_MYODS|nr:SNF-related serine/threonine-protein kinase [Myotis davidii]